jgi:hypothetical protein
VQNVEKWGFKWIFVPKRMLKIWQSLSAVPKTDGLSESACIGGKKLINWIKYTVHGKRFRSFVQYPQKTRSFFD